MFVQVDLRARAIFARALPGKARAIGVVAAPLRAASGAHASEGINSANSGLRSRHLMTVAPAAGWMAATVPMAGRNAQADAPPSAPPRPSSRFDCRIAQHPGAGITRPHVAAAAGCGNAA
jgi:hypothetical protein